MQQLHSKSVVLKHRYVGKPPEKVVEKMQIIDTPFTNFLPRKER